jgi:c-di-AMP phosphodiesterase-like protein
MYEYILFPIILVTILAITSTTIDNTTYTLIDRYGIAVGFAVIFFLLFRHNYQKMLNYLINDISSSLKEVKEQLIALNTNTTLTSQKLDMLIHNLDDLCNELRKQNK